jgi:hypothetical protein
VPCSSSLCSDCLCCREAASRVEDSGPRKCSRPKLWTSSTNLQLRQHSSSPRQHLCINGLLLTYNSPIHFQALNGSRVYLNKLSGLLLKKRTLSPSEFSQMPQWSLTRAPLHSMRRIFGRTPFFSAFWPLGSIDSWRWRMDSVPLLAPCCGASRKVWSSNVWQVMLMLSDATVER